jgi:hypothetical protein
LTSFEPVLGAKLDAGKFSPCLAQYSQHLVFGKHERGVFEDANKFRYALAIRDAAHNESFVTTARSKLGAAKARSSIASRCATSTDG